MSIYQILISIEALNSMKPLEVERPWIKSGYGKKTLAIIVIILIATLGILSAFDFYSGTTVNIQAVNVNVTESGHKAWNFSFAYGKFTYGGRSNVPIQIVMTKQISDYITENKIRAYNTTVNTAGFSYIPNISTFTNNSGIMETIVHIVTPDHDYFGSLNITLELTG